MTVIATTTPCEIGEVIPLYAAGKNEPENVRCCVVKEATLQDWLAEWQHLPPMASQMRHFYFASLD